MASQDERRLHGGAEVRAVSLPRAFVDVGTAEVVRSGEGGVLIAAVPEILLVQSARNAALLHGSGGMSASPRASRSRALMVGVVGSRAVLDRGVMLAGARETLVIAGRAAVLVGVRQNRMVIVMGQPYRRALSRIFTRMRAGVASGAGRVVDLIGDRGREERRVVRRGVVGGATVVVGMPLKGVEQASVRGAELHSSRSGWFSPGLRRCRGSGTPAKRWGKISQPRVALR